MSRKSDIKFSSHTKTNNPKPRCQEVILQYQGNWPSWRQCSRPSQPGIDRCKTHSEEAKRVKEEKSNKKHRDHMYKHKWGYAGPRALKLINSIANGYNNPRQACIEFLKQHDKDSV